MMGEIWKDIHGSEGVYQVSNIGNIRSIADTYSNGRKHPKQYMAQFPDKDGYLKTSLYINKKKKQIMVHRLVALAFIPNPHGYSQVNHKDENKQNNHVDNLEWCNAKYNTNYGTRSERISGEKHGLHKLTKENVLFIRKNYVPRDKTFGLSALSKRFHVTQSTIRCVICHKTWTKI